MATNQKPSGREDSVTSSIKLVHSSDAQVCLRCTARAVAVGGQSWRSSFRVAFAEGSATQIAVVVRTSAAAASMTADVPRVPAASPARPIPTGRARLI